MLWMRACTSGPEERHARDPISTHSKIQARGRVDEIILYNIIVPPDRAYTIIQLTKHKLIIR